MILQQPSNLQDPLETGNELEPAEEKVKHLKKNINSVCKQIREEAAKYVEESEVSEKGGLMESQNLSEKDNLQDQLKIKKKK
jgi:hypothetical protein